MPTVFAQQSGPLQMLSIYSHEPDRLINEVVRDMSSDQCSMIIWYFNTGSVRQGRGLQP